MNQNQIWLVRGTQLCNEGFDPYEDVLFEMAFSTREEAHRVYHHGERTFNSDPSWRWHLHFVLADNVDFAIHSIDQLHKEAEQEREREEEE